MYRCKSGLVLVGISVLVANGSPAQAAAQTSPQPQSFDSDGASIQYYEAGQGETVVLVHGYTADAQINWIDNGVFELLAEEYRVVAMDVRGHGGSERLHDPGEYGLAFVSDVIGLMDHLGTPAAHLVGYSMGGDIVMNVLVRYPSRVTRAVVGGAGWFEPESLEYQMMSDWSDVLASVQPGESAFEALFPGVSSPRWQATLDRQDPQALAAAGRGVIPLVLEEEDLRANQIPVLLLIGGADESKPAADKALSVGGSMEMQVIPGENHTSVLRHADFAPSILRFLKAGSD